MPEIQISVVIVSWNTRQLLLDCIGSIRRAIWKTAVEVIVVDNGSTDGSAEAVQHHFPEVLIIRNSMNSGFAAANNTGIRASCGRYVCLVNSDVSLLDGCLDRMFAFLEQHPEVGAVGPQVWGADGQIQPTCSELPTVWNSLCQAIALDAIFPHVQFFRTRFMRNFNYRCQRDVPVLSGCFLMVRRQAIEQAGLLDETFFIYKEDVDWCKRFREAGWRLVFYPAARVIHYGGASSASAPTRFMIEMEKANNQYWQKHHTRPGQLLMYVVSSLHYGIRCSFWLAACALGNHRHASAKVRTYAACLAWVVRLRRT